MLDAAIQCAKLVGQGLYGVDLKQHGSGVYVIEINDNPNIDAGIEDAILGDLLYRKLLEHLLRQFEAPALENAVADQPAYAPGRLVAAHQ